MTPQHDLMGREVTVIKLYQRAYTGGRRKWLAADVFPPIKGWIVGFRTIYDGYVDHDTGDYGQREGSNYFIPTAHHECALVVFSPRQKPLNVPLDGFTPATGKGVGDGNG